MRSVIVIISSYNGSNKIIKQLDSIFNQEDVDVTVYVRDDNSKDDTIDVLEKYKMDHPECKLIVSLGNNYGYAKSFWTALNECGDADYYAFSDQDDIWCTNKLIRSITELDENDKDTPQLSYCRMYRSDENLKIFDEQVKILPVNKLTKKLTLTKTFNYGAATVINHSAKELICRCWPDVEDLPHDLWAGMLCFWFGKVYYIDEPLYYWIRYDDSVTGEGTKKTGCLYRIRKTIKKKSYTNVAKYLLENYNDLLDKEDFEFLARVVNYKYKFSDRIKLLLDRDFCRDSIAGTLVLKMGVLFGWY